MKKKKGFTLIELLAVMVIIAIVLAIAIPRISNYEKDRKKDLFFSVAKNILREIEYENIGSEESLSSILSSIKIDVSSNQIDIDKSKVYRDIDGEITINLFGKGSYDGLYLCNVKTSSKKANYEDNICLPNKISVDFNPMGGVINLTKKEVSVGETYGELPIPVKENYAFIGWFYNNEKIEETTRVECDINHVLIAKYKYNTKLTVDLDDGTTTQTFNERYQEGETIALVAPVKTNYTFTGWKIVSGNAIMSGNSLTFGSNDVVIKALYKSNTTSITLNLDGGTISTDVSGQYTIGQTITLETPTKSGYDFSKWQITIGNSTLSGNKLTIGTTDTTIKAIWIKKVTLTLNLNGGTITSNASGVYSRKASVTLGTPTKTGYDFSKWQITAGDSVLSGNKLTIGTTDTTIKAIYTAKKYTVTYNANGGTVSGTSKSVTYNAKYGTLPTPKRAGYSFLGWYTAKTGGSKITETTIVKITSNQTIYAQWKQITYDLISKNYKCKNSSSGTTPYYIEYTGNCTILNDGSGNWRIKFTTSGTVKFNTSMSVDIFLVGGGGGGGTGCYYYACGSGGGGGYTLTKKQINLEANTAYPIVIGAGGKSYTDGESSKAFGFTAAGGLHGQSSGAEKAGDGGSAGGKAAQYSPQPGASDGGDDPGGSAKGQRSKSGPNGETGTTREFGEETGALYAGGGGASGYYHSTSGAVVPGGAGGAGGGGTGGKVGETTDDSGRGSNGTNNTGGGGGGAWPANWGGTGGSGIVIIRNKR